MNRRLRIGGASNAPDTPCDEAPVTETARVLSIDEDAAIRDKVDALLDLDEAISAKKSALKRELESLEFQAKELRSEVEAFARTKRKSRVPGNRAEVEFSPGMARAIDPRKLLEFLRGMGKTAEFWSYVSIPLKDVIKHYGEAVLEAAGILQVKTDDYANMKIRRQ